MTPPSMIAYLYIVTQLRSQNWCYGKNLPVDRYSYFFCGGYTEQTAKDGRRINIALKQTSGECSWISGRRD
ncbi:MAG: hypothetical protein V7L31_27210 [Nostoc sp.]|uniref:hypothetical protein n=1 Tax=Nostoc sp. TaxID=1180 RepID=UPI002FF04516